MGLVVTLQITESNENRMLMTRSRFPKAMGGMMLGISFVFFIMFKAADTYLGILYNLGSFIDKALVFTIFATLIIFSLTGLFLLFYDKRIEVDKKLEEICFRFRFFFPIWKVRIKFAKIDEIILAGGQRLRKGLGHEGFSGFGGGGSGCTALGYHL